MIERRLFVLLPLLALACASSAPRAALTPEESLFALAAELRDGKVSAEDTVLAALARIEAIDRNGPELRSILAVNPDALEDARALDKTFAKSGPVGPLHGVPIVIKDNIETKDPLPTTAGSLALAQNLTLRDAPVVAKLRAAGAIILGKANLSEWANIRSSHSTSGWSAVGGLTKNPYALDRNPCGSSSGSAVAVAASLGAGAVGTETDGSITCPAAMTGVVGLKPTVGLVSRTHVVPISHSQDTPGPIARSVRDVALLLTAMAGSDAEDAATKEADDRARDYAETLDSNALRGKRLGVMRFATGYLPEVDATFERAIIALRQAGAEVVDIAPPPQMRRVFQLELQILLTELRADLDAYLATTPPSVLTRTLADVIAFNEAHADRELLHFGQELFHDAMKTKGLSDPEYSSALEEYRRIARTELLDQMFGEQRFDALIAPTTGPAWTTDLVTGDHFLGSSSTLPAVAGYPHLTVPMGFIKGLPVGISFIGPAWSEAELLALGYAYEQATHLRAPPKFLPSVEPLP